MCDRVVLNRVVKVANSLFYVEIGGEIVALTARKKFKRRDQGILVGDFVTVGEGVIEDILPRRNFFVRPSIANIDQVVIVVCSLPKPDLLLVDKVLVNCRSKGIEAVICVNKSDLDDGSFFAQLCRQYADCDTKLISVSAELGDIQPLRQALEGKLSCLAGQSAVGKSTIVNALTSAGQAIGELSRERRGKHTTTASEIFWLGGETFVADTPGFALVNVFDIDPLDISSFYPEYAALSSHCRFARCSHITEPDCAIVQAVEAGELSEERYQRYCKIFADAKLQKMFD